MPAILEKLTAHKLKIAILIAILIRLVFLGVFYDSVFGYELTDRPLGSEAYDEYAINLLETGVYGRTAGVADANIPPLYSYVVAGVYGTIGRGGLQIGLLHILFDVLTMLLLYDTVRRLFAQHTASDWIGVLSVLFYAGYPYLVFQNLTLNDTALFMLLMHAFIWGLVILRERENLDAGTFGIAVAIGLVLGITTLGRAILPLLAILSAFWFLFRLSFIQTVLRLLPVAIVSVLVLIPWIWRNYQVYDDFVPVALNTGENIWQGSNDWTIPLFTSGYDAQWSQPPEEIVALRNDSYRKNEALLAEGITWLQENPDQIPQLLWVKFLIHWDVRITPRNNPQPNYDLVLTDDNQVMQVPDAEANLQDVETIAIYSSGGLFDTVARPVHVLYFGGLLILSIMGIALSLRYWRDVSLLWFVQISMTVMYVIFHPSTRYRAPTDPLLFAFAAFLLVTLYCRYRGQPHIISE